MFEILVSIILGTALLLLLAVNYKILSVRLFGTKFVSAFSENFRVLSSGTILLSAVFSIVVGYDQLNKSGYYFCAQSFICKEIPNPTPADGVNLGASQNLNFDELEVDLPKFEISNSKSEVSNFRSFAGNRSTILKQIPSGTIVTVLGMESSPTSGHPYCRVLLDSGEIGYIDSDFVVGDCSLSNFQFEFVRKKYPLREGASFTHRIFDWLSL